METKRYSLEKLINYTYPLEKAEEALKVMGFEV